VPKSGWAKNERGRDRDQDKHAEDGASIAKRASALGHEAGQSEQDSSLANSEGWNWKLPICSQRREPRLATPIRGTSTRVRIATT